MPGQPHVSSPVAVGQGHAHGLKPAPRPPRPLDSPSDQTSADLCRPGKPTRICKQTLSAPAPNGGCRDQDISWIWISRGFGGPTTSSAPCSPRVWRWRGLQKPERVMESKVTRGHKEWSREGTLEDVVEHTHTGEADVQP